jgi:ADP-ribose pyrophosphatase YjhB (NUDIX family)
MYIRIYFGDKPLFLCDEIDRDIEPFLHHDDAVFIDELDTHTVKSMIHEMQQEKVHAGVFLHKNLEELKKTFFKKFTIILAAGGRVSNERSEVLLIFRKGKWDLPKGKLDEGEKLEDCAVREVEEETGLKNVKLIAPLITTWHTYHEGSKYVLKESHWFQMEASGEQHLVPQTEEDIHEIRWINRTGLKEYLENAYASVREVLTS